jgi:hypothetical protein
MARTIPRRVDDYQGRTSLQKVCILASPEVTTQPEMISCKSHVINQLDRNKKRMQTNLDSGLVRKH